MKTIEVKNRAEWRLWLTDNHDREKEVWLVFYKKATGMPSIAYAESLDEALCFGWIDSLIKNIDEVKYVRKFTPRKDDSQWSLVNKKRVEQLIQEGLMTEHGLKKVDAARLSGKWDNPVQKPKMNFEMPSEFALALRSNPKAEETFNRLALTYQKQYLGWIGVAKRPETRQKRIEESIQYLAEGKKLGLK